MYDFHKIDDGNCPVFELALPRDKGEYTTWLSTLTQNTDVALFALDYLSGSGTLIDVGANVGAICTPVAVAGSNVIAVEMLPENFFYLTMTALQNKLANMRLFQLAAGEDRKIVHYSGTEAWGYVVPGGNGASAMMLPLDDIINLSQLQDPGFVRSPLLVKIDTEGHELHVLHGARRLIEVFKPAFFVECIMIEGRNLEPDLNTIKVKNFLEDSGYHLYLQRGNRLIPRAASDIQEGHVADFFATKRNYRPGERIGRFIVSALELDESIDWIAEMVEFPVIWHRMHAAGVLARWIVEGRASPRIAALMHRLMEDQNPDVAAFSRTITA
jgi:FkbM family methyltransferase